MEVKQNLKQYIQSKEYSRKELRKIFVLKIKNKNEIFLFIYSRKGKETKKRKKKKKKGKKGNCLKI